MVWSCGLKSVGPYACKLRRAGDDAAGFFLPCQRVEFRKHCRLEACT